MVFIDHALRETGRAGIVNRLNRPIDVEATITDSQVLRVGLEGAGKHGIESVSE